MTKRYIIGVTFIVLSILLFIAPFGILFAYRYDDWTTTADGTSIATGVMVGGFYMFIVMKGALKRVAPLISMLVSTFIMTLVVMMLESVIQDLGIIFASVTLGLGLFIILYKIGARQIELAKEYGNETVRIKARNDNSASSII